MVIVMNFQFALLHEISITVYSFHMFENTL